MVHFRKLAYLISESILIFSRIATWKIPFGNNILPKVILWIISNSCSFLITSHHIITPSINTDTVSFYSAFRRSPAEMWFSLSIHSIVTAQTRLEWFGVSTVSNVNITFGSIQFVSRKSHVYTCINIYNRTRYITFIWQFNSTLVRTVTLVYTVGII